MDDDRIWKFEANLWKGDADVYRKSVEADALMALPAPPFIFSGEQAIKAVEETPRWSDVKFEDGSISRPQDGLIVIAYTAHAQRDGEDEYIAHCTSTYRKDEDGDWHVVQHSQTPKLVMGAST